LTNITENTLIKEEKNKGGATGDQPVGVQSALRGPVFLTLSLPQSFKALCERHVRCAGLTLKEIRLCPDFSVTKKYVPVLGMVRERL